MDLSIKAKDAEYFMENQSMIIKRAILKKNFIRLPRKIKKRLLRTK